VNECLVVCVRAQRDTDDTNQRMYFHFKSPTNKQDNVILPGFTPIQLALDKFIINRSATSEDMLKSLIVSSRLVGLCAGDNVDENATDLFKSFRASTLAPQFVEVAPFPQTAFKNNQVTHAHKPCAHTHAHTHTHMVMKEDTHARTHTHDDMLTQVTHAHTLVHTDRPLAQAVHACMSSHKRTEVTLVRTPCVYTCPRCLPPRIDCTAFPSLSLCCIVCVCCVLLCCVGCCNECVWCVL